MKSFNEFLIESIEDQLRSIEELEQLVLARLRQDQEMASRMGGKIVIDKPKVSVISSPRTNKPLPGSGIVPIASFNPIYDKHGRAINLFTGKPLSELETDPETRAAFRHEAGHLTQHEAQLRDFMSRAKRYPMGMKSKIYDLYPQSSEKPVSDARYFTTDIETNARALEKAEGLQNYYRTSLQDMLSKIDRNDATAVQNAKNMAREYAMKLFMSDEDVYKTGTLKAMQQLPDFTFKWQAPPTWMEKMPPLYSKIYKLIRSNDAIGSFPFQPPEMVTLDPTQVQKRNEAAQRGFEQNQRKMQRYGARILQMVDPDLSTPEKMKEFDTWSPRPGTTTKQFTPYSEPPKTTGNFSGTNYTKPVWARGLDVASKVGSLLDPVGTAVETGVGRTMGRLAGGAAGMYGLADMVFGKEAYAPSPLTDAEVERNKEYEEKERRRRAAEVSDLIGRGYDPSGRTPGERQQ